MGKTHNHPLRAFTPSEEQELYRVARVTSERLDAVKRARALLSVQAGQPFTEAARETGYKSGDSIGQLVERFNQRGLAALLIAPGRGRKPIYTDDQRGSIIAEVQRQPDPKGDQTATWSLMLLRQALLWCQDEAGPYQAIPQPGEHWHPAGKPALQPHEYVRGGTAKLLTLFCPVTGLVRAKGVLSAPNAVLHPWVQRELQSILDQLDKRPPTVRVPLPDDHPLLLTWRQWWWSYEGSEPLPALRLILIWDNLAGHLSCNMVRWLLQHGILPLYTPLSGSWLNMAESLQRIIVRRALSGQHFQAVQQVIDSLEGTVDGWNQNPTPFPWNGKRRRWRERARLRRLGGSGAAISYGYSITS